MSQRPTERLYNLLPAIYRQRDAEGNQALRALLAVIEAEMAQLESDIDAAYDDLFIETCSDWVIPYLADLVGISDLAESEPPYFGQRRRVANQLAYERRKGVPGILSHIMRDVSGWPALALESARLIAQTLDVRFAPHSANRSLATRDNPALLTLNTPFDTQARTLRISSAGARHGRLAGLAALDTVAVHLWRLRSYPLHRATAGRQVRILSGTRTRHFAFDVLGRDIPLLAHPQVIDDLDAQLRPHHFPHPLSRDALAADLLQSDAAVESDYVGPTRSLAIWVNDVYIRPSQMLCSRLDGHNSSAWLQDLVRLEKEVVIDPENGRMLFKERHAPGDVTVRYAYGHGDDVGSHPVRRQSVAADHELIVNRLAPHGSQQPQASLADSQDRQSRSFRSLADAIQHWHKLADAASSGRGTSVTIRVTDSTIHTLDGDAEAPLEIRLPAGCRLAIEAGSGERPLIRCGGITVIPQAPAVNEQPKPVSKAAIGAVAVESPDDAAAMFPTDTAVHADAAVSEHALALRGLLLDAPLRVQGRAEETRASGSVEIVVHQCTLLEPLTLANTVGVTADRLTLHIHECIMSALHVHARHGRIHIHDSIVDSGGDGVALSVAEAGLDTGIERCTVFGDMSIAGRLVFGDSILLGTLTAPAGTDARLEHSYTTTAPVNVETRHCLHGRAFRPVFISRRPTHPNYAQLAAISPGPLHTGGSNGGELGAYSSLQTSRRRQNIEQLEADYLPLGHKLRISDAT